MNFVVWFQVKKSFTAIILVQISLEMRFFKKPFFLDIKMTRGEKIFGPQMLSFYVSLYYYINLCGLYLCDCLCLSLCLSLIISDISSNFLYWLVCVFAHLCVLNSVYSYLFCVIVCLLLSLGSSPCVSVCH